MDFMSEMIKILFRFVPRPGWLPYDTEGMWARRVGADTAVLMNAPFLQDGVAEGDTVRYTTDADGRFWSIERVGESGNCTVRVLPIASGPLGPDARAVHQRLAEFGVGGEAFSDTFPFVAFTVPVDADLAGIKAMLEQGQSEGWWHFEVGCATPQWWGA
jgi:hypothetical protein